MKRHTVFFIWLALCQITMGQNLKKSYPTTDFSNPLEVPLELAGTFGEIRSNHLHSGLDLRTENREGLNVFSVGDGYVSRIKVSAYGYGNALYITHPNGYVSVYGHLKEYMPRISEYVKQKQYEKESFEIDLFPKRDELPVKKGEIVALSGNTGGSESPHLHFEIRDAVTEEILNPQFFGYIIEDKAAPVITQIALIPKYGGTVNSTQAIQKFPVTRISSNEYAVTTAITVNGPMAFGIECYDPGKNGNKNGVYALQLYIDNKKLISESFDKFAFDESRFVNALILYEEKVNSKAVFQVSNVAPNNKLKVVEHIEDRGIVRFDDKGSHKGMFIIKDFKDNTSIVKFTLSSNNMHMGSLQTLKPKPTEIFPFQKANVYKTGDFSISIPPYALYDTLFFEYSKSETIAGNYSPIHKVHNRSVPVQLPYTLSIKPLYMPLRLRDKAVICLANHKSYSSQGGKWDNGFVTTKTRSFGDFVIMVDTVPPEIKPLNIRENAIISKEKSIRVGIRDNLSGLKSYRAAVDGKWILMEFESKSSTLTHTFDGHITAGEHTFELTVTDDKDNVSVFRARFIR